MNEDKSAKQFAQMCLPAAVRTRNVASRDVSSKHVNMHSVHVNAVTQLLEEIGGRFSGKLDVDLGSKNYTNTSTSAIMNK